jgi:hypothetical protein
MASDVSCLHGTHTPSPLPALADVINRPNQRPGVPLVMPPSILPGKPEHLHAARWHEHLEPALEAPQVLVRIQVPRRERLAR